MLAAGSSRRMGKDKLLLKVGGERVLYRTLAPLICSAEVDRVILVVRPGFTWPDGPANCRLVENPDFEEGMGSSMAAGVRAAPDDSDAYLIALGDMPDVKISTLHTLIDAFSKTERGILRPSYEGQGGHPVILGRKYREQLIKVEGDIGAREILKDHLDDLSEIPVDDGAVIHDIDTIEDLIKAPRVLIKGAGEMASAVAHQFFLCGFQVMMTDIGKPTVIRRAVSFANAIQCGETEVEGVRAQAFDRHQSTIPRDFPGRYIPVWVDPACELAALWKPDVLIDARVLKRKTRTKMSDARLVIGLGPGFTAGEDVHLVVETNRGHDLGRLITKGEAQADTGTPGTIKGETRSRVLRSPATGIFEAEAEIGDIVQAGQVLGFVRQQPLRALISGVVRGLIHSGYEVSMGQKIGDVDPRGEVIYCSTISEKARNIGGSCLRAVLQYLPHKLR